MCCRCPYIGADWRGGDCGVWGEFQAIHPAEYGHSFEDSPFELVNLRVTAVGQMPKVEQMRGITGGDLDTAFLCKRYSVFRVAGSLKTFETLVYRRDLLPAGGFIKGPAILLQKDSTAVVPPKATARLHTLGSLIITLERQPWPALIQ